MAVPDVAGQPDKAAEEVAEIDLVSSHTTDGMLPSPQAPVWPMDAFRDRFLTAFGSPAPH
jgi:hypothetical protein